MDLCGRRVVIGHGDVLGRRGIVGKVLSGMFRSRMVQWFFSLLHPDIAIAFGYRWSGSNRKAKPVKHSFRAEDEPIVGFARDFLREQPVDLFVCGHIHCAEIYPLTDVCSIVFLGEWIENPVYGVLNETGFELKTYSGTNEIV